MCIFALFLLWNSRCEERARECDCVYLGEVVMYVERSQLGEVSIEAQGHKEASVLIGQLGALWLVVGDPRWVNLNKHKIKSSIFFPRNKKGLFTTGWESLQRKL